MKYVYVISSAVLLVAVLVVLLFTFGLFQTSTTRTMESTVGSWVVKANGTDITANNTFSINNVIFNEEENTVRGKLAPSGSGYFDIIIDPSGSDVSVRYDIIYDFSELEDYDFTFNVVENGNRTLVETAENQYTGVIALRDVETVTSTVRCNFIWNNNENNNEQDSVVGLDENAQFSIPVEVVATQYLGETISTYIGNN